MYEIRKEKNGVLRITFDEWDCPENSFDPIFPLVKAAAEQTSANFRVVDSFFEYETENEDFCAVFSWNGGFTITILINREKEKDFTFKTLLRVCNLMNSELRKKKVNPDNNYR